MATNPSYLIRTSVLYCLRDLAAALEPEDVAARVAPVCVTAAADQVPNIRFVAAKVLQSLRPMLPDAAAAATVVPCLEKLGTDDDVDVRHFSAQALAAFRAPAVPVPAA